MVIFFSLIFSEPTGKLCENGLVYVSYGNPHNRSSYERDDRKFCCPINQTEVEYTDSESDIQYLECCPGNFGYILGQRIIALWWHSAFLNQCPSCLLRVHLARSYSLVFFVVAFFVF